MSTTSSKTATKNFEGTLGYEGSSPSQPDVQPNVTLGRGQGGTLRSAELWSCSPACAEPQEVIKSRFFASRDGSLAVSGTLVRAGGRRYNLFGRARHGGGIDRENEGVEPAGGGKTCDWRRRDSPVRRDYPYSEVELPCRRLSSPGEDS